MTRLILLIALGACALSAQVQRLSLEKALEIALQQNPEIQLANLRRLEAEVQTRVVQSGYRPQVMARVQTAYQTTNLQNIGLLFPGFGPRIGPYRVFDARPVVQQTVLDLSLLSSIRSARAQEKVLQFDLSTAREATLLAVLQLFLQVQQSDSRIAAAEARLRTAEAILAQARQFEESGTASKLDVARAEQQYHAESSTVTESRRDRDVVVAALVRTIGLAQDPVELETPRLSLKPLSGSGSVRPELRALDARLTVAELDRQKAERERLPKIAFSGDYGVAGTGPDRSLSTFTIGAVVTMPLWTSGRIDADVQAARIRMEQTRTQRRSVELQLEQERRQAGIEADAALLTMQSAGKATAAARTALELARLRFSSGIATNLDTITAQGALAQAEDFEIRARYDYQLARARQARAMGNVMAFLD